MARPKTYDIDELADRALSVFWEGGFHATSMDDLVQATKVSRHGIYSEFGGKKALFLACLERYKSSIVNPAFDAVEQPNADLSDIENYFEHQIALAETFGLPGLGCFVANASTEIAPQDTDVAEKVSRHNDRLKRGFSLALQNSAPSTTAMTTQEFNSLAAVVVIFANGLWSLSRTTADATILRDTVASFLKAIRKQLE